MPAGFPTPFARNSSRGADFPKWILQELTGRRPRIGFDHFTDGLLMLRYDAEIWVQTSDLRGTKVSIPGHPAEG